MIDSIQQRISEIAQQIPGYAGYQAKERRRDADKIVRQQLAAKYEEQRTRLTRLQQQVPLAFADDIERVDQKLRRLIARLTTAPRGYAGWFNAAQIVENDLDQLIQFDGGLADGVNQLQATVDQLANALKTTENLAEAIDAIADTLDALNAQFDAREQFVALGKKPSPKTTIAKPPASPLQALQVRQAPPTELVTIANLKVKDAVSFQGTDYVVAGKITYSITTGSFWAFLLEDNQNRHWLRLGPGGEVALVQEVRLDVPSPLPESVSYENQSYARTDGGIASVVVEGAGGVKRGSANYARYGTASGARLWLEDFGTEKRALAGEIIDVRDLTTYRR